MIAKTQKSMSSNQNMIGSFKTVACPQIRNQYIARIENAAHVILNCWVTIIARVGGLNFQKYL